MTSHSKECDILDQKTKQKLVTQTIQRIVQIEPLITASVNQLDLNTSLGNNGDTINTAQFLSNTLAQMDADLVTLVGLLDN